MTLKNLASDSHSSQQKSKKMQFGGSFMVKMLNPGILALRIKILALKKRKKSDGKQQVRDFQCEQKT